MSCRGCRYFDECSAPICPLDLQSLTHGAWFPDEETCHRQDLRGAAWITRQRKIARVTGADFTRGAFRHAMLTHEFSVRKSVRGLDPDAGPFGAERVARWIREHETVVLSSEEKQRRAKQGRAALERVRSSTGKMPDPSLTVAPVTPEAETVSAEGIDP